MGPELELTITDADLDRMEVAINEMGGGAEHPGAAKHGAKKDSIDDAPEAPRLDA